MKTIIYDGPGGPQLEQLEAGGHTAHLIAFSAAIALEALQRDRDAGQHAADLGALFSAVALESSEPHRINARALIRRISAG
jgi:hypothetical protein